MNIDFFIKLFSLNSKDVFLIWQEKYYDYKWLINNISGFINEIESNEIPEGSVVGIKGDFTPKSIALLFALINKKCILVPLSNNSNVSLKEFIAISKIQYLYTIDSKDKMDFIKLKQETSHNYYNIVRKRKSAGLVLFTSGSSGKPKAAVHDLQILLKKFNGKGRALRTLNFLLFDHWGGLNTMFHILSSGGSIISTSDRNPKHICKLIEKYKVQVLPTSPTFLKLLLLSQVYKNYDLSSLKIISYGTEPMPEIILKKLNDVFPDVKLVQTYGLIELGVMKSQSENDRSLWVKIGGEGFRTRIINGILHIKADSAMLGYLNSNSPFTHDGWFVTGDKVLKKGDYIKILGRQSELINVGGEKVYPQEVENIILGMDNVLDVTVYSEPNPITGNIVCAKINLCEIENSKIIKKKLQQYCKERLEPYKIPLRIIIEDKMLYNERFKKNRHKRISPKNE